MNHNHADREDEGEGEFHALEHLEKRPRATFPNKKDH